MLRFGPYEFEPAARRITQGGQAVHLTPKAFDLLHLLIDAAPRCVAKQEIHERLWQDHVVSDATLVGRDPACDVWIDDATVSRRHARVVVNGQVIALEDLGSKNGTRIGHRPIAAGQLLNDGDRIHFGVVEAIFRDSPSHLPTRTQHSMTG